MAVQPNQDPRTANKQPSFPVQEQDSPGQESKMNPAPDFGEQTYKGMGRLEGKVALITGADSGIGRAVALAFAREGADVAISYLSEHQDAKETQRVVEAAGRKSVLIAGDIAEEAHCKRVIEETVKGLGRLDILVNNAAMQGKETESIDELTGDRVLKTFQVNIVSMFNLCRFALPHLKEGATIINTSSIQAYQPSAGILDYAATKGAIVTFTKGLAQQLIQRGIRVNSVAPGPVWTPLIAQSFPAEKVAEFGKQSPMQRPAQPAELAPSYVFLASDESRYVNAEILGVTGGKPLA
ncbi:MAG TPA: SDR family oxidoreductase [Myxococcaceae bacterium]|nr:SDR family oxidoreductase [Myxococcaceae bacterium]